jgi:lipoprotein-anchoring transpeptidase ErfK/SrfK
MMNLVRPEPNDLRRATETSTTKRATCATVVFALIAATACVDPSLLPANRNASPPPANTNTSNTNAAHPVTTEPASEESTASPVTLAVLDALLFDPAFAEDLKAKVGLSADELEKLRRVAGDARASLSEDTEDETDRSTSDATVAAARKLEEAIGAEKAEKVLRFAQERWAGGDISQKPGSVPTDTRIVVNAPAYRLDVYDSGKLVKTYVVGIGYPEFPLPSGLRKAETIIFNPTWTPPDEPWVKGKVKPGEKIEAGDPRNPLGPIKIPIGLPSLIHGGKSPSKLGTFASHGCVGMTTSQILEFTRLVAGLGKASTTDSDIDTLVKKGGETKSVKLSEPIPVELRYETIAVEDGRLHVYRDVYDRKTNTEAYLSAVLAVYDVSLDDLSEQERTQAMTALKEMSRPVVDTKQKSAARTESGAVTSTVKGKKEAVVEIKALAGKGYPAPVDRNAGSSPKGKKANAPAKRGAK